jgi:signal transduction histidine kinase
LPTTRKIIEAHGGSIAIQSEVDRGTKVAIRLPASAGNGASVELAQAAATPE